MKCLQMPRFVRVAAIVILVLLVVVPLSTVQPAQAIFARINLSSESGFPGETFELRGSRFPALAHGTTFWGDDLTPLAISRTGKSGSTRSLLTVPEVAAGTYEIHHRVGAMVISTKFTVLAPGNTRLQDSAETPPGEPTQDPPTVPPTDVPTVQPTDTATIVEVPQETATVTEQPTQPVGTQSTAPAVDLPTSTPAESRVPSTVTVLPVADAYVSIDAPSLNFGRDQLLKSDESPEQAAYLRFNVSGVGPVSRAVLRLYVSNGTGTSTEAYAVSSGWDEGTVTWANRPLPTTDQVTSVSRAPEGSWVDYDVSSLVSGDGTFDIGIFNTHSDGLGFSSREGANPPQLVLTPGSPQVAPVPTVSPGATTFAVRIDGLTDGSALETAQEVQLVVTANGPRPVTTIELYDNSVLVATGSSNPFGYTWTAAAQTPGDHVWTAIAIDDTGVSVQSDPVKVTVGAISAAAITSGTVTAAGETAAVPHSSDAADDPAIWIHPTDPAQSTIIGTDKLGGLAVYDLSGKQLYYYADSSPNNVDLRYNFPLNGVATTIVVTSDSSADTIRIYRVNPTTRALEYVAARSISVDLGVAGICLYYSSSSGKYFAFVGDSSGNIQQWELFDNGSGKIDAKLVRTLKLSSVTEGMVADDGAGALYVSQEDVALWRFKAEPNGGTTGTKIDNVDGTHITADAEGLAIYYGGDGYLIVSSQGSDDYSVYRRDNNAFLGRFRINDGTVDGVTHTDGIDVTNVGLGGSYASGLFVAQDNDNNGGNQNFKLIPWDRIAKTFSPVLSVSTSFDPRTVGGAVGGVAPTPIATTRTTFYIDSVGGSDSNSGTSSSSPWKSLSKANSAPLQPGDRMLFKRGSSFTGQLEISRSGASGSSILIGAYGSGSRPLFQGTSTCGQIAASYIVLQDLQFSYCSYAGISVEGSKNVIRRNVVSRNVVGIVIVPDGVSNRVQYNVVRNNNKMRVLTKGGSDDNGAFGILLRGDKTDVAYNTIVRSDAFSYDYGRDGAAVEIYGGRMNHIHHNVAQDNDAFTELGNSRSRDNTFAYNVVTSTLETSTFVVTRGDDSGWGPIYGTRLYNNTVLMTGAQSQGFVCSSGCSSSILIMRNNVIQAVWKVGYADHSFDEDYNLYYGGIAQFTKGSHSVIANPKFVDPASFNLRLLASSPAIDRGVSLGYTGDYAGAAVPRDGNGDGTAAPDLGAYEY